MNGKPQIEQTAPLSTNQPLMWPNLSQERNASPASEASLPPMQQEFTQNPFNRRNKILVIAAMAVIIGILSSLGLLIVSRRDAKNEPKKTAKTQMIALLDHPFQIPENWYVERREDFATSEVKTAIISPNPIDIVSENEGRAYQFNPIIIMDFSNKVTTREQFQDTIDEFQKVFGGQNAPESPIPDLPPNAQAVQIEGRGKGTTFNTNQKYLLFLIYIAEDQNGEKGSVYYISLATDDEQKYQTYKPIAEEIVTSLIQSTVNQ